MKINKIIAIVVMLLGLLAHSLGAGVFLGQGPPSAYAAPPAQENDDADDVGEVDDDGDGANVSPDQTGITADEAKTAAEAANPGAKALDVDLENENGTILYEVELDNGLEVMVDAANGNVLGNDPEND
jgi:uncharacterized membrane protein YkoI